MSFDFKVYLHRIWSETDRRLDSLSDRVRGNVDVMAALDFSRWLFFSGLLELLEANSCEGLFKVDGPNLRWKCEELRRACQERFRLNDSKPHLEALQLQSIREKLDMMAGYLSKLVVAGPAVVQPDLRVIYGALEENDPGTDVVRPKNAGLRGAE